MRSAAAFPWYSLSGHIRQLVMGMVLLKNPPSSMATPTVNRDCLENGGLYSMS